MKKLRPFTEARKFVRSLGLKSVKEWQKYSSSGQRPKDIPSNVASVYKNKGWKSWGDFLSSGNIQSKKRKFRVFKEAKKFAHTLNLRWMKEWKELSKKHELPFDIPSDPKKVYLNKGWNGSEDFLGIKKGASKIRKISHVEAVARAKKGWANRKKKGKKQRIKNAVK